MAKKYFNQELKSEILSQLENSELTRPELAEIIGIGGTTLSKIINGEQKLTKSYARKFSSAFNLEENHFDDFIYYEVDKKKTNLDFNTQSAGDFTLPKGTVGIPVKGQLLICRLDELKQAWKAVAELQEALAESEAKAEPDGP